MNERLTTVDLAATTRTRTERFYGHGLLTLATDDAFGLIGHRYVFRAGRRWEWLCAYVDRIAALVHDAGWVAPDHDLCTVLDGDHHTVTTLALTETGRTALAHLELEGGWL